MSYIYQSRQLHPRSCSSYGFSGTEKRREEHVISGRQKQCDPKTHYAKELATSLDRKGVSTVENNEVVPGPCFRTGKHTEVWEETGKYSVFEWCCPNECVWIEGLTSPRCQVNPVPKDKNTRKVTRPEMEQYGSICGLRIGPSGEYEVQEPGDKMPVWFHKTWGFALQDRVSPPIRSGDGEYFLFCRPWNTLGVYLDPVTGRYTTSVGIKTELAPVDTAVLQQHAEATQQEIARRESIIQESAVPEGNIIERYGFPLLLIAGTIGIGVTAALFKRFSVASKQAKDAKAIAVSGGSL